MPAGAPRTVSPPPEECIRLGEDLIQWLTEKTKEPRLLLGQWWCIKHKMLRKDWKALTQIPEFLPYYEQAQQFMALKCLDGTIKEGFAQRYIRLYDRTLTEEENEKAKFDAEIRKPEQAAQTQKVIFEVNYKNDNVNDQVSISSPAISVTNTQCPEQGN